jgi:hypothetical protein
MQIKSIDEFPLVASRSEWIRITGLSRPVWEKGEKRGILRRQKLNGWIVLYHRNDVLRMLGLNKEGGKRRDVITT